MSREGGAPGRETGRRRVAVAACVLVAALAVAAAAPGATAADPASVGSAGGFAIGEFAGGFATAGLAGGFATEPGDGDPGASFPAGNVSEHRGDVVSIPVALPVGGNATVAVESVDPPDEYAATVVVRDGDGDGRVRLRFNTYLAGLGATDDAYAAAGADAVAVRDATSTFGLPPAGEYALRVAPGAVGEVDASERPNATERADAATLRVLAQEVPAMETLVAPGARFDDLTDPAAMRAARRNGTLAPGDAVAVGDVLVVRLRATGLWGAIRARGTDAAGSGATAGSNASDGFDATAGFAELTSGYDGRFHVTPDGGPPVPGEPSLNATDPRYSRLVADPANDTYWLAVDTRRVRSATDGTRVAASDVGESLRVNFSVAGVLSRAYRRGAVSRVRLRERTATLDGTDGGRYVAPASDATVSGRTTLAPGTELQVVLSNRSGLDRSRTVAVRPTETGANAFAATFDLSALPDGERVRVVVFGERGALLTDTLRVDRPTASVGTPTAGEDAAGAGGEDGDPGRIRVPEVRLSRGGFVVVWRATPDRTVVAVSRHLPPGEHGPLSIPIREYYVDGSLPDGAQIHAVAYRDLDGDGTFDPAGDVPYRSEGANVSAVGVYRTDATPAGPASTSPPAGTRTTAGDPGPAGTVTDPTGTPDGAGRRLPGFGLLLAAGALLLAALLARARRR